MAGMGMGQMAGLAGGIMSVPLTLAGSFMGKGAADDRIKKYEDIANTPGLDFDEVQGDVMGTLEKYAPRAGAVAGQYTRSNTGNQLDAYNQMDPNFAGNRESLQGYYGGLMRGEVPQDVQDQLQRSAAVQSLQGGYGGSGMHRNLMARDLGLNSLQLMQQGAAGLQGQQQFTSAITPQAVQAQQFGGPTTAQALQTRSNERSERITNLLGAAGLPTGSEVMASGLMSAGSQLASSGQGGGAAMGGLLRGSGGSGMSQSQAMSNTGGLAAIQAAGGGGGFGMIPGY